MLMLDWESSTHSCTIALLYINQITTTRITTTTLAVQCRKRLTKAQQQRHNNTDTELIRVSTEIPVWYRLQVLSGFNGKHKHYS